VVSIPRWRQYPRRSANCGFVSLSSCCLRRRRKFARHPRLAQVLEYPCVDTVSRAQAKLGVFRLCVHCQLHSCDSSQLSDHITTLPGSLFHLYKQTGWLLAEINDSVTHFPSHFQMIFDPRMVVLPQRNYLSQPFPLNPPSACLKRSIHRVINTPSAFRLSTLPSGRRSKFRLGHLVASDVVVSVVFKTAVGEAYSLCCPQSPPDDAVADLCWLRFAHLVL